MNNRDFNFFGIKYTKHSKNSILKGFKAWPLNTEYHGYLILPW